MFTRFILASSLVTVMSLVAGWANAETRMPGRCVTIETLVTDPVSGAQHIQRKVRCEYTAAERRAVAGSEVGK